MSFTSGMSARQAAAEHVLAVSRDFISQPRLSKYLQNSDIFSVSSDHGWKVDGGKQRRMRGKQRQVEDSRKIERLLKDFPNFPGDQKKSIIFLLDILWNFHDSFLTFHLLPSSYDLLLGSRSKIHAISTAKSTRSESVDKSCDQQ
jgi:hypothetical protein